MTRKGDNSVSGDSEATISSKKSDVGQQFLRAARAGNLQKLLTLINQQNADIHACNANGLNALHLASKEGYVEIVQELLQRGAHPNKATKKGNTALHIASLAGQYEVVKLLIESGADVNVQAQNGFTPLYMAAQENHLEAVRLLLANNANPGLTTDDGFTPLAVALQQGHDRVVAMLLESDARGRICLPALHIAAKKDDTKAANLLLNSDVNVDHQSASGFTPLHIAAHYGNISMTELLISRGANINFQAKNNITPLHVACKWGNLAVAERLIAAGAEMDCRTRDGLTPLHCAARSGHDTIIQVLLNAGANLSSKTRSGLNALHMAAQGDHIDAARLLLQHGAQPDDPTIDYLTALHVASHCGNLRVAKLLVERGCDVNARALNGFTALHIACQKSRQKIVELLLKHNSRIESTTESGLTPLHVACFMGQLNIAVQLLQYGANVNAATVRGETSLHLATRVGQVEIARLLLRNGAQADVRSRGNQTPLHIASRNGSVEMVHLLLDHSADIQAETKDTYTPLHLAAKCNHTDVCELLLKKGAQLEVTTKSGFTPLHLAVKHSHIESSKYLIKYAANVNAVGRNGLTPLHLATHYGSKPLVDLLLENGASPIAQAKNGFIPLHIAAEKSFIEIAKLLLSATDDINSCLIESRNGFTALHLSCQSGNVEVTKLFIDSGADVNALAKNGLTAMHLAAQEDNVKSAELLFNAGAQLDLKTKAGYTPLHTACHFGQVNMVRFLLGKGANVNSITTMESSALHLSAQQGHSTVVYVLLESGADPNMRNKYGWTPAHVAKHQHYLNIFEVLKQVTTCVESWAMEDTDHLPQIEMANSQTATGTGKHLEYPDLMRDNPITDTEEEFVETDYTLLPASPLFSHTKNRRLMDITNQSLNQKVIHTNQRQVNYTNRTANTGTTIPADKMSNISGEDSIHEGTTGDNLHDTAHNFGNADVTFSDTRITRDYAELEMAGASCLTGFPGMIEWDFAPDNVPISRKPIASGFLVSFLVDARGGSMRGSRHPGLRVLVPLNATSAPTRITCRMLRPERTTTPPQLNDCEGLACRIIELGPYGCRFNSSVLLEIPYFASLRGRQRELVILRSDNSETWREHSLEATDQAVQSALGQSFAENLESVKELREKRIIRILTNDFPQYLAIVSRLRQESSLVGSDGGVLSSTVVPQVQAVFPEGALQKRIRVGLQAQIIPPELVARLSPDGRIALSPIVTLEPRRRKFHKPITLTIPLPKLSSSSATSAGQTDHHHQQHHRSQTVSNLRLLCSITGGTTPAHWEDITGSTPLSKVKECVSFTTTVSARFWLMDCQNVHESAEFASRLYAEATMVPYMGKFVVFTKRLDSEEALVRCFCVTDDKVDKTLECQEGFEVCAASPEVEIVEDRPIWLEVGGNLLPVTKMNEQLHLNFNAFRENRLAFPVRLKNPQEEPVGKLVFMREPRNGLRDTDLSGDANGAGYYQKPICTLEIRLGKTHSDLSSVSHQTGKRAVLRELQETPVIASLDQLNALSSDAKKLSSMHCVFPTDEEEEQTNNLLLNDIGSGDTKPETDENQTKWTKMYTADVIARSQIDLIRVANEIGSDWPKLVGVLIPQSRLHSMCTVEQLVHWINDSETRWRKMHPNTKGPFGGQLMVTELRTVHDQALAVLLAWCEEYGTDVTGNQLDRALRQIGREDVVKSCMSDIRYVVDVDEYAKASRQIDDRAFNLDDEDEADLRTNASDFLSASLVATDTLLSGMNDSVTIPFDRAEHQPPDINITPLPDESELIGHSETIAPSVKPTTDYGFDLDDVGQPVAAASATGDEQPQQDEEDWQSGPEPVRSTSQYGGDPLLMLKKHEGATAAAEELDMVRDSESMSNSSEQIGPNAAAQTKLAVDRPELAEDIDDNLMNKYQPGDDVDELGGSEMFTDADRINQYLSQLEANDGADIDDDDDEHKSNLSEQSDLVIQQPTDHQIYPHHYDEQQQQQQQQRQCDTSLMNRIGDQDQYFGQTPINGLISDSLPLENGQDLPSDQLRDAHHEGGELTNVYATATGAAATTQLEAYNEDPTSVASADNSTEIQAAHAHHGIQPTGTN